jgi:hypothetical protein
MCLFDCYTHIVSFKKEETTGGSLLTDDKISPYWTVFNRVGTLFP